MSLIDQEDAARRLAFAILADATLYQGSTAESAEARVLYQSRVIASLHPLFDTVLAEHEARGMASAMGERHATEDQPISASARRAQPILVVLALALLGLIGYMAWRAQRVSGDEVGSLPIPGVIEFEVSAGDRLSFTVDTEVLFRGVSRNAKPEGCQIEFVLEQSGGDTTQVACDPFGSEAGLSIASGTDYSVDDATGLVPKALDAIAHVHLARES